MAQRVATAREACVPCCSASLSPDPHAGVQQVTQVFGPPPHIGDPDGIPGPGLWLGPALVVVSFRGVNQYLEDQSALQGD